MCDESYLFLGSYCLLFLMLITSLTQYFTPALYLTLCARDTLLHFLLVRSSWGDKRLHSWRTPGGEAPTLDSSRSLCFVLPLWSLSRLKKTTTTAKCTSFRFWQQLCPVPTAVASRGYTGSGSFQLISSHFSASCCFFNNQILGDACTGFRC